jgi:hypothetical protein
LTQRNFPRRALFGAALLLPLGACSVKGIKNPFQNITQAAPQKPFTLTERGDRMVRWLYNGGKDAQMAPEAFAVMGLENGGRDIFVKQFGEDGPDGRYVISLVNVRKIHEFVLHHASGDVLIFHHCDTAFVRQTSVRYPRNGKPVFITDTAFAVNDFQKQLTFWFDRMPGR